MPTQDDLAEKVRLLLGNLLPPNSVSEVFTKFGTQFRISSPDEADYSFEIHTGEPQIHAELKTQPDVNYFWYWPFEEQDYAGLSEQEAHFLECVKKVIKNQTRITQYRSWIGTKFTCEALDSDEWQEVGGTIGCLSWWWHTPRISGRKQTYSCPALCSAS